MAISFVAASAVVTGANPTVSVPVGYQESDLLIIITTGTAAPTAPVGWTLRAAQGAGTFTTVYTKFAIGLETSVALTIVGTTTKAVMLCYRGVSATNIIGTFGTSATTSVATVSQTTTQPNDYVISIFAGAAAAGQGSITAPASTTSRLNSGGSSTINSLLVVDELQATAGASTARTATFSGASTLASLSISIIPSGRYWVGGTGTWTTTTTNWAFSSGGTAGAPAPTAQDDVFFDQVATYAVSLIGTITCKDLIVSAGPVSFNSNGTLLLGGSLSLLASTVWTASGTINFTATSPGKTITTNGVSLATASMLIAAINSDGEWTLGSALTISALTISRGTFNTNNYALTISSLSSSSLSVRTINLGSSIVTVSGTSSINFLTQTNLTFNAGTSSITLSSVTPSINIATDITFYNVSFTTTAIGTTTLSSTAGGTFTFNNLSHAGMTVLGNRQVVFGASSIINGALTLSAGTNATMRMFVRSDIRGVTRTLTVGTFTAGAAEIDFRDITVTGAAAPISGTRFGNCLGNSGITFPAGINKYWNLTAGGNWSAVAWATTSGGTTNINNFPLAQDTPIFEASTGFTSGSTLTIDSSWNIGTLNLSARSSGIMYIATGVSTPTLYGDFTFPGTGVTLTGTGAITFGGSSSGIQTITTSGRSITQPITINAIGTVKLIDALTISNANPGALTLSAGTLDLNGKTLSLINGASTFLTTAGTKNITFNGGTLVLAGSGATVFNNAVPTGFTTTAGTGTGTISMTSTSAKTFVGGDSTFNCTLNQPSAGALTIAGSNTFSNITNTYNSTGATTITFTNGTTNTFLAFSAIGTAGNLLTLNNTVTYGTTAITATINISGTNYVTNLDYLSIKDLIFAPFAANGTLPYLWYAGANSVNAGNNSGILFTAYDGLIYAYLITTGSSWAVPANWNNANNTIHLIGGGGGGGAMKFAAAPFTGGGGGGGGGYTKVINATLSGNVSFSVGSGGTAGRQSPAVIASTAGGTTTFGAYTAGGGGAGANALSPSTGGTAGVGSTYNGGAGGAGGSTSSLVYVGGGGGGGAGGPNGAGGAGGAGSPGSGTASSGGGGGGGGNGGGAAGTAGSSTAGGTGGNNFSATGGGAQNTVGTFGGGAGGARSGSLVANPGGRGIDILGSTGSGGGAGGGANSQEPAFPAASGGLYGGGGSGGGGGDPRGGGGQGASGMIFILYSASAVPLGINKGNFFLLF